MPERASSSDSQATSLRIHDFGGGGTTLFFVHATGFHGRVWTPVADRLIDEFHCVAVDLRGHGDSPVPAGDDLHWDGFGSDVLEGVAAVGGERAVGVGHSLGGAAVLLAEIARPGTFSELILYEPAASLSAAAGIADIQTAMVNMTLRRQHRFDSKAAALANYARKEPTARFSSLALYSYVEHGFTEAEDRPWVRLKCEPGVEAQVFRQGFPPSLPANLSKVRCPVTMVIGGATDDYQRRSALEVAGRLGATVVELDAVGHFGPLQHPDGFAALVRRILAEPDGHPVTTSQATHRSVVAR